MILDFRFQPEADQPLFFQPKRLADEPKAQAEPILDWGEKHMDENLFKRQIGRAHV